VQMRFTTGWTRRPYAALLQLDISRTVMNNSKSFNFKELQIKM